MSVNVQSGSCATIKERLSPAGWSVFREKLGKESRTPGDGEREREKATERDCCADWAAA